MFVKKTNYLSTEKLKSIKEDRHKYSNMFSKNAVDRKRYRICVIDDEGFDRNSIDRLGYGQVVVDDNFKHISTYEVYDIILCDIKGVHVSDDSKHGGVEAALQLKSQYSNKIVVLYTGINESDISINYEILDGFIQKGLSGNELSNELDKLISDSKNPVIQWKKIENELRKDNVKNKDIAIIEDLFCRSISGYSNQFETSGIDIGRMVQAGRAISMIFSFVNGIVK